MDDALKKRTAAIMAGSAFSNPRVGAHSSLAPTMDVPVMNDQEMASDFDVSHDDRGNVILSLGLAPAFKVPKDVGIKLALLILKHCGVEVEKA